MQSTRKHTHARAHAHAHACAHVHTHSLMHPHTHTAQHSTHTAHTAHSTQHTHTHTHSHTHTHVHTTHARDRMHPYLRFKKGDELVLLLQFFRQRRNTSISLPDFTLCCRQPTPKHPARACRTGCIFFTVPARRSPTHGSGRDDEVGWIGVCTNDGSACVRGVHRDRKRKREREMVKCQR
jgi:hypothetical protein